MNKKILLFLIFFFALIFTNLPITLKVQADTLNEENIIYYIYDTENNKISETNYVEVGDKIITKDFKQYEVYKIDENTHSAYSTLSGTYIKPRIIEGDENLNLSKTFTKSVGLYLTHNDESYVPSDNTSSVYGEGGIHDVANYLADCFESLNYNVYLDETLHLPHDSSAYSRSRTTATALLNNNLDAIFDIHRDGVSRSVYVDTVDGIERCKVRIVVGQANENHENNLKFAMYMLSIAENYCPWLFLDIYYAKGDYNQDLTNKSLLFEMGTYLAEKELVLNTVPFLTEVVDKTLFASVSNNTIDLNPSVSENDDSLINNALNKADSSSSFQNRYVINVIIFASLFIVIMITIIIVSIIYNKKRKHKK